MNRDQRNGLKLLHTADVHLGDQTTAKQARLAFQAVVESANAEAVDLFIVAGDLFDSNREGMGDVEFAIEQLSRLNMPAVILPGNHDPYDETSIYRRVDFEKRCPNVKLISRLEGELLQFEHLALTLWGKPVVDHHPGFRPIADLPPRQGDHWHVGIAHGFHIADGQKTDRSSPISSGEIAASGWDYIALGHVHPFRDVSQGPVISCYSGTPVRMSPFQQSAGFVVIVHLDHERGVSIERLDIETAAD